jgi:hypothetical protein
VTINLIPQIGTQNDISSYQKDGTTWPDVQLVQGEFNYYGARVKIKQADGSEI